MSVDQLEALKAMIASRPPAASLEERRAGFEAMASRFPMPDGVAIAQDSFETEDGQTLRGRWVRLDQPSTTPRPRLLYLHGGAFILGSSTSFSEFGARLALASGHDVFLLDYRLAPEHPFPAGLDDARSAYRWLLTLSDAPIAIGGDSAGANLALATAQSVIHQGLETPSALYLLSGYLDLTHSGDSIQSRGPRDVFVRPDTMLATAATYIGDVKANDPSVSPLFGEMRGLPPTLIQVGEEETLFDDSARLAERCQVAGVTTEFEEWPNMIHVFAFFGPLLEEAHRATDKAGAFLAKHSQ